MPGLVLIDGGIGQLHAAAEALESLGIINQPLASIAKREELIYVLGQENEPIALDRYSPILHLVQNIRDEAHRFAVTFHRTRRNAQQLTSELHSIPGVGEKTVQKLLKNFGSLEMVRQASEEALSAVVGPGVARRVGVHQGDEMNITITGATGFIGRRLTARLTSDKHDLHILTRGANPGIAAPTSRWDPLTGEPPEESLAGAGAVVHLAGEPVAQRWTAEAKKKIRESRVLGTRRLVQALSTLSPRPSTLVCASAIGIYGSRGDEVLTESSPAGSGFLAEVCREWEKEAELAESLGIRVARIRTGIALGKGGALAQMIPPFKAFVGGRIGSGKQWMSWIHLDDLVGIICHAIENPMSGAVNGTAPNPVINSDFTGELASALHRPALFPVPEFALKALFGEMASVLLASQRIVPRAAEAAGYKFQYPELGAALRSVLASE